MSSAESMSACGFRLRHVARQSSSAKQTFAAQKHGWCAAGLVAAAVLMAPSWPASAATPATPSAAALPSQQDSAQPARAATQPVTIEGFRSARFGMTEAEVRRAIATDFHPTEKAVGQSENQVQRTRILDLSVPDLLRDGGIARVDYVFGMSTHTLIEVDVTWSAAADPEIKPQTLVSNGEILQSYFLGEDFASSSVTANAMLTDDRVLLFHGQDVAGHAVTLTLAGTVQRTANDNQHTTTLVPTVLSLVYAANPTRPDVFRLQKGAF
jgi:hypothetical protein